MADTVQFYLERMVPELEDLEKRGFFSSVEIKSIVKKRTNFEYALKRRITKKIDYLRCIEYEMNLETLRKKRKARMNTNSENAQKTSLSDYAGTRRIYHLFQRALNKFKGDIALWMQYIDFAKKNDANNLLSGIFVKALQLHPAKAPLWIMAASWEYEENANIGAARVLMQRALRLNPHEESLWHEYFRLELLYVEKIKARRRILGIDEKSLAKEEPEDEDMEQEDENTIKLPTITGEEVEDWNEETEERKTVQKLEDNTAETLKEGMNPILKGLLAKIIYNNAIQAIPNNLDFCTKFVDYYRLFTDTEEDCDYVFETIRRDMNTNPRARAYLAKRHLFAKKSAAEQNETADSSNNDYISISDPAFVSAIQACVEEFNASVQIQELPEPEMWELYIEFLTQWKEIVSEENLKLYLSKLIQRTFKKCQKSECFSEKIYEAWIKYLVDEHNLHQAQDIAMRAVKSYPQSAQLWISRIELAQKDDGKDEPQQELYDQALKTNPASFAMWSSYNDWLMNQWKEDNISNHDMDNLYMQACQKAISLLPSVMVSTNDRNRIKDLVLSSYVQWAAQASGIDAARTVYKKIIQSMYPTYEFYRTCVSVEKEYGDDSSDHVEYVYEMATRLDNDKQGTYLSYLSYLYSKKKFQKANHVYWKAANEVTDKNAFEIQFQQIKAGKPPVEVK
ncbi:U3 snoRNP protein [Apophysomyces sp. BC1034]|nr:U3 snoRNP protein [Apophysomyces sp. BC1015]KAG0180023.1 U3 snoRNP protein [Apophysomyces sp. BC1021]KAG0190545.1 U3 snoRNP protein [Apophysomyces sp. BC1034]